MAKLHVEYVIRDAISISIIKKRGTDMKKLIAMIRELNPNVQIILTTHSPAVIMEGWLDAVTEVSDISTTVGHKLDKDSPNCNL